MRRLAKHLPAIILLGMLAAVAATHGRARAGCAGQAGRCQECVPAGRGTWDEKTSSKPVYSMTCEYACVRGRDPWHAPPPECRCHPPCGDVIVKKRFFKAEGPERVERVPTYEVILVPVAPAREPCDRCRASSVRTDRFAWWNPLDILHRHAAWW